ncbi:lysosome membrane protein 2-like [Lingula anatina]|uniref:Lysosome membrane protein 2-like n=1 Tax=Lingula anatina TaxID=7574 RepID=A0A1S3KEI9_LINAN|nr:lysosome membrane protein 2-like [Lingula anatina]|eukprot:XP_013421043.1 lysosome membrane protein 2-like [Lingula anatina]
MLVGQPAIVSLPHFYQGDQSLVDAFDGLHPTKDVHQTFLDVEPYTGALLRASKRLQVNIWLQKISRFTETDHLPDFLPFPVMWLNESALVEESTADELKSQLLTVIKVSQGGEYAFIAIGSIMVLVVICIAIFRCQRQRDDQLLHSVNTDDRSDYGAVGSRENTYNNGHSTQM